MTDPTDNLLQAIRYARERYGISDQAMAFRRRRGPDKITEPTEADWEAYRAAIDAADKAAQSPFIDVVLEIEEPSPQREPGDYIETEDEWIARVAKLLMDSGGQVPDDLDRALSMREARTLMSALGETGAQVSGTGGWKRSRGYEEGGLAR